MLEVKVDKAIENQCRACARRSDQRCSREGYCRRVGGARRRDADADQSAGRQRRAGARHSQKRLRLTCRSEDAANRRPAPRLFLTLSKEELRSLRDYAVDQSLETIRNRIDQFGVSEPIIQRQGQTNILIQLPGIQDPDAGQGYYRQDGAFGIQTRRRHGECGRGDQERPAAGPRGALRPRRSGARERARKSKPYVLESRALMTGEYIQDARVRPAEQLQGPLSS